MELNESYYWVFALMAGFTFPALFFIIGYLGVKISESSFTLFIKKLLNKFPNLRKCLIIVAYLVFYSVPLDLLLGGFISLVMWDYLSIPGPIMVLKSTYSLEYRSFPYGKWLSVFYFAAVFYVAFVLVTKKLVKTEDELLKSREDMDDISEEAETYLDSRVIDFNKKILSKKGDKEIKNKVADISGKYQDTNIDGM